MQQLTKDSIRHDLSELERENELFSEIEELINAFYSGKPSAQAHHHELTSMVKLCGGLRSENSLSITQASNALAELESLEKAELSNQEIFYRNEHTTPQ